MALPGQPQWMWDRDSQQWFFYDEQRDTLVFQNGRHIPRPKHVPRTSFSSAGSSRLQRPYAEGANYLIGSSQRPYGSVAPCQRPEVAGESSSLATPPVGSASQEGKSTPTDAISQSLANMTLQSRSASAQVPRSPAQVLSQGTKDGHQYNPAPIRPTVDTSDGARRVFVTDPRTEVRTSFQDFPAEQITDPVLWQNGITARRRLFAADEDIEERLFPGYRRREQPKKFFTVGKVFLVLWVEPAGESVLTNFIPGTSLGRFGERVYSKVRRFVVIREAESYCTCLPIVSYGYRGVGKSGVKKSEHSIIYTTKQPPEPLPEESPRRAEEGMRPQAIKIDVDDPTEKLDTTSRLDYGKVYTVQHNIKVKGFGKVNPRSMNALVHQFGNVWNSQPVLGNIGISGGSQKATVKDQHRDMTRATSKGTSAETKLLGGFSERPMDSAAEADLERSESDDSEDDSVTGSPVVRNHTSTTAGNGNARTQFGNEFSRHGSRAPSNASVQSRTSMQSQVRALVASLLSKGYTEEDAKEAVRTRFKTHQLS